MSKRKSGIVASQRAAPSVPNGRAPGGGGGKRSRRGRLLWLLLPGAVLVLALGAVFFARARRPHPAPVATSAAPALALPPAEQTLRDTLARLPRDPDARRALARYLLEQHRPFEALWHFRYAQELRPTDADTPVQVARALIQAGLPAQALSLLRARLQHAPVDPEARRALAEAALATARPADALAALTGAGAALATSAPAQLLLGDARVGAGDLTGAEAAYRRAVQLEPEVGGIEGASWASGPGAAHDRLGRVALMQDAWAAARSAYEAARERDPGEPGHGYRLGLAYWGAGNRAEAEQLWGTVAEAAPGYAPVRLALGQLQRRREEWDAAAVHLVAAVRVDPASEEAQSALAAVMTAQGDRASAAYQRGFSDLETDRPYRALAEFHRMIALAPDRVDGPLMASFAYIQMKRLDQAAVEARHGLERHPHEPRLLGRLGLLYVLGRNRLQARQLCAEWLKADPNAAEPYRLLGRIAREEVRLPESLQFCEQALARDPQNAVGCSEISKTLSSLPGAENARRALEMARQATVLNPEEPEYWQQLGVLLRGAGRLEEAVDAFLRALDLNPLSVPSCTALVQIAGQEGRADCARFYAALVTALQQQSRVNDPLWRAVNFHPEEAAAHERLGRFLLAAGNLRRARYQLQQVVELRPGDTATRRDLAVIERLLALREK